jgi:hypothetical protein
LGCKECCFESAASGCFSVDLVCFTVFILLIELEQDIKITIRSEDIGIFLKNGVIE